MSQVPHGTSAGTGSASILPRPLRPTARSPLCWEAAPSSRRGRDPRGCVSGDISHGSCLLPLVCPLPRLLKGLGEHCHRAGHPCPLPLPLTLVHDEPVGARALLGALQDLLQRPVEKLGLLQAVLPAEGGTLVLGHGVEGLQRRGVLHCAVPELQGRKKKRQGQEAQVPGEGLPGDPGVGQNPRDPPRQLRALPCTGAVCWTPGTGMLVLCGVGTEQWPGSGQVRPRPLCRVGSGAASLPWGPTVQPLPLAALGSDFPPGVWSSMERPLSRLRSHLVGGFPAREGEA